MRKKLVLFSSLLATLPTVLAAEPGSIEYSVVKAYNILPIGFWNPILAFILVAAIINGALSLTNLGKEGGDRRGFGLIAGSLGGIFSIFVAVTGFDLISFVMPYLFLILLLFMFSIVSVFITPRDDKRNKMRSQGTALIITGALLWGINGAVTDFTEKLGSFKVMGAGDLDVTASIFALTPYTTLLAIIFIVWGLGKVISSFSDDEDNPSFLGGVGNMKPWGRNPTKKPKASIAAPGTIAAGTRATFNASVTGGTGPYNYDWTFEEAGRGAPHTTEVGQTPTHTFTNAGTARVTLEVTDAARQSSKKVTKDITVTAGPTALALTLEVNSTIPAAVISPGPATVPGQPINFTATATGGTAPYTYTWTFATPPPPPAPAPPPPTTLAGPTTYTADYSGYVMAIPPIPPFNITVNVTDNTGATESETFDLTIT
jgi:hypothetical protein